MKSTFLGTLTVAVLSLGVPAPTPASAPGDHAAAPTLVVGVDAPTLVETLALARDGDIVQVPEGIWEGPARVDARIVLRGPGTIDGGGVGSTLRVAAPEALVTGLTIRNSGSDVGASDACVFVEATAVGARLEGNTLLDCAFGIWIHEADEVVVAGNDVTGRDGVRSNDRGNGIHLFDAERIVVRDNDVRGVRDGLYVSATDDSVIENNRATDVRFGIHYMYSQRNVIRGNVTNGNTVGVALMQSRELVVENNVANDNERNGILFRDAFECRIVGNQLERNGMGMFFFSSTENEIHDNRVAGNEIGVKMWAGSLRNHIVHNALVANAQQVFYVGAEDQVWAPDEPGNYWSDYIGWDQDGDGIGDRPHRVDSFTANLVHRYPSAVLLMRSPVMELLTHLEARMPLLRQPTVIDLHPRMRP